MIKESETRWHIDKGIPVTIIVALLLQAGAWVWWVSALSTRVHTLENRIVAADDLHDDVVGMKVKIDNIEKMMARLIELRLGDREKTAPKL